jgi:hypothetical protein
VSAKPSFLRTIILLLLLFGGLASSIVHAQTSPQYPELAKQLLQTGYPRLLIHAQGAESKKVWTEFGAPAFELLAADTVADPLARMLALEVMHLQNASPALESELQAAVYARVLATHALDFDNPWGSPDHLGPLSLHVVAIGPSALSSLRPLLRDSRELYFDGPHPLHKRKDAGPRVKDLTASIMCAIQGQEYVYLSKAKQRDRWIRKMVRG